MSEENKKPKTHVVEKLDRECWHPMCESCGETPCPTMNFFGEVEHWNWGVDSSFIPQSEEPTPAQYRWRYYKAASHHFFGPLPKGERRKLPDCVVKWIRDTYPNKNGEAYVGFKRGRDDGDVYVGNMTKPENKKPTDVSSPSVKRGVALPCTPRPPMKKKKASVNK